MAPEFAGIFWAPDILFFNNEYHLYYAVSTWGSQVSAIGLATNPTLDPADPDYKWTDQGPVINSLVHSPYNTIDPSFVWDAAGNLWMAFGSYWNGIYMVQLNSNTGLRISPNSPVYHLAYNSSIEASYIYHHGDFYYLFVNWGSCCAGVNSTYNIRVGRSLSVTGPYLDRQGRDMANNGGALFMEANGKFTGPGHVGILSDGAVEWLSYHYYDANTWSPGYGAYGASKMDVVPLSWTEDGWPQIVNDWSAVYDFQADASDAHGQYSGLLENGASIKSDPVRGHVLNLNGDSQYVWLPPGVAYAKTFIAVVKWHGGGAWQRIFDFGNDASITFMLTPSSGDGVLRCDINPGGNLNTLQWSRPLPEDVWTQVAVTLDGSRGILYLNGAPVSTNTSMNLLPLDLSPQTNHLGRSKFSADPYFNGQYSSFRVYDRTLTPEEIAAPVPEITEPADQSAYSPGATVRFAGHATDFLDVPLPPSHLTWSVDFISSITTNTVFGPMMGATNGSFSVPAEGPRATNGYYQVVLWAADDQGRTSTNVATLFPTSDNSTQPWRAFYSFAEGAGDSSNRFNGTLEGGARIAADPDRGNVLDLSGDGQYASLPSAAGVAQTTSCWVKWRGGDPGQRIFEFSRDSQHWFYLTPSGPGGRMLCSITADGVSHAQSIVAPDPFPINQWTHLALVLDGRQGILAINGKAVAVNNSINLIPADVAPLDCYLGKGQSTVDPYFNGQLDSFELNSTPLSDAELMSEYPRPALNERVDNGSLELSWPEWGAVFSLYSTSGLSSSMGWTSVTNQVETLDNRRYVKRPIQPEDRFFRLQWP